jgi:hypothetical protein
MSKYSQEVEGLVGLGLAKTINEIGARVGNYGAYTYNSRDVKGWINSMSYYASIANFLDEYVDGDEEMDFEKLSLVIKLSLSSSKAGSSSVVSTSYTQQMQLPLGVGVSLLINNILQTAAPFSLNENDICDMRAVYTGPETVDMIRLEVDSLAVAEEATSVFLSNYKINYVGIQTKEINVYVYFTGNPVPSISTYTITIIT